jgi:hypothetical protein
MKYIPIILLGALLLSCGEQKKQQKVEWSVEVEESHKTGLARDTMKATPAPREDVKPMKVPASSSSGSVKSSSRSYDDEYDTMRGWDPASEDDMDDNGMSRYMENNDEEGWD